MLYPTKTGGSPVTIEYFIALSKDGQGSKVHGRPVWKENEEGERELCIFDLPTRQVVPHSEFVARQKRRARERAKTYQSRRKKMRERYTFA